MNEPSPFRTLAGGQAFTEFLVVVLALLPLFLLMPVIGKYQDIAHSTRMASRYVAFEAMTRNAATSSWKPEAQLADEVRRRFFSNSDAPIKTHDRAGNFAAHRNPFWSDPKGDPLIKDFNTDITISFGSDNSSGQNDAFSAASDGEPFLEYGWFDLRAQGIYTAKVSVALANLPGGLRNYEPFDTIDLSIARSTSVVIDPWTAAGPKQAEARFGGNALVFPAGSLKEAAAIVDALVSVIDLPGGVSAPALGKLDFWRDVVPEDRLR